LNQTPFFKDAVPVRPEFPAIAHMRFSLDGVPEGQRSSLLREFFGQQLTKYDYEPEPGADLVADLVIRALPGLVMIAGREHGFHAIRSRRTVTEENSDDIALGVNLGGPMRINRDGQELTLDDGEAILASLADIFRINHRPPGGMLALRVPRNQIAPLVEGIDDLCYRRIPAGSLALKFLIDYVKVAEGEQRVASPELQALFVRHVQDLMALTAGATRDAVEHAKCGGLRAARLHAIKKDIASSLDQPNLSVTTLAARHGLTPRCVQRLFETDGTTFTEYVLSERLRRAYRMLVDPRRQSDKITSIAWDCGFGDISHFNHVFRRRYGVTPSDVRAQARENARQ
jgi:AraC-like DNA-binding protein